MKLLVTMETMHAAGRRNLPPVPRAAPEAITPATAGARTPGPAPVTTTAWAERPVDDGLLAGQLIDPGQAFVTRLRAAATAFADAAGAESAVVREVVPPARHRRSRCRVVLRYADRTESDLTFVGERRRPGSTAGDGLDTDIARWLSAGQLRDPAWLVPDPEAPDGLAVDVTAWLATG